jgi:hypothetical protein
MKKKWGIPPDQYASRQQQAGRSRRAPDAIATIVRQGLIEDILFPGGPVGINELLNQIGVKRRLSEFYCKQPYRGETIEFLREAVNKFDFALHRHNNTSPRLYKKRDGVSEDTVKKDLKAIIRRRTERELIS